MKLWEPWIKLWGRTSNIVQAQAMRLTPAVVDKWTPLWPSPSYLVGKTSQSITESTFKLWGESNDDNNENKELHSIANQFLEYTRQRAVNVVSPYVISMPMVGQGAVIVEKHVRQYLLPRYTNYVNAQPLVQSSGMGSTKVCYELSKAVPTVYLPLKKERGMDLPTVSKEFLHDLRAAATTENPREQFEAICARLINAVNRAGGGQLCQDLHDAQFHNGGSFYEELLHAWNAEKSKGPDDFVVFLMDPEDKVLLALDDAHKILEGIPAPLDDALNPASPAKCLVRMLNRQRFVGALLVTYNPKFGMIPTET